MAKVDFDQWWEGYVACHRCKLSARIYASNAWYQGQEQVRKELGFLDLSQENFDRVMATLEKLEVERERSALCISAMKQLRAHLGQNTNASEYIDATLADLDDENVGRP